MRSITVTSAKQMNGHIGSLHHVHGKATLALLNGKSLTAQTVSMRQKIRNICGPDSIESIWEICKRTTAIVTIVFGYIIYRNVSSTLVNEKYTI